ncbi:MAG: MlaA family lipoprotein [Pseudomarimonas sp.]
MRYLIPSVVLCLAVFFPIHSQAQAAAENTSDPAMQTTAPAAASADSAAAGVLPPPELGIEDETRNGNYADIDPWERVNRPIFKFNSTLDRVILRPVAVVYSRVTPKLAQRGVGNFFTNLQQPITSLNLLLQGHPVKSAGSLGRFLLNSTLGVAGIFDPATEAGIPPYDQDFGQTLHRWGWKRSRYVMLPLFGPATIRDGVGKGINTTVSPISRFAERYGAEYSLLYGVSARARGLSADAFLRGGGDEYLLMREAFLQYRRCQLIDCSDELPDYMLPDFEIEVPDVDAMRLRN